MVKLDKMKTEGKKHSALLLALTDVGSVPYALLKEPLRKATPKQLYRIERANPHLIPDSDELWLAHCLYYSDIRQAYNEGQHQDPRTWRQLYLKRFEENERKKRIVSEKIKNQYNKIQDERAARSIKVLKGAVPSQGRGFNTANISGITKSSGTNKRDLQYTRGQTTAKAKPFHAYEQCNQYAKAPVSSIKGLPVLSCNISYPIST
ncbi:RNA polymerase II transcription factor SIII subunit A3 [Apophysomyces ossiformis]|uniref:RNA polymerase II transcription factor SIII subunit A3 n=1 Tax=Apophysomyces ossiformis TaxID=679940 RepID=A0A8H7C0U9_9FUNG|nr:RNA polymerase II transcription factor SIII subunit A3 [Apophysomyces ossiformis]